MSIRRRKVKRDRVIAERRLEQERTGAPVIVRIERPRKLRGGDWACSFALDGLDNGNIREVVGVDALQALTLCLTMLKVRLDTEPERLTWMGGTDLGLTLDVSERRL